jgi:hypothetical protein
VVTRRDDERITVEVTQECYSRSVIYRGRLPALIIGDGTDEVLLLAGPKFGCLDREGIRYRARA